MRKGAGGEHRLVFSIREGGGRQASHPNGQRLFSLSKSLDFYHAQGTGGEHRLFFNIREEGQAGFTSLWTTSVQPTCPSSLSS